jgi:hypothetical protein
MIVLALITIGLILTLSLVIIPVNALTQAQVKVVVCNGIIKGIKHFIATYKTPAYNNSISKFANFFVQNMTLPLSILAGYKLYNNTGCQSVHVWKN